MLRTFDSLPQAIIATSSYGCMWVHHGDKLVPCWWRVLSKRESEHCIQSLYTYGGPVPTLMLVSYVVSECPESTPDDLRRYLYRPEPFSFRPQALGSFRLASIPVRWRHEYGPWYRRFHESDQPLLF